MRKYKLKNKSKITRKHIVKILEWCKTNLGDSDFFDIETLRIRVHNNMKRYIGLFDIEKNCIYVKPKSITDELDLIATIIHEYVHFQQDYDEYERLDSMLPRRRFYFDHPHEKQAEDKAQSLKLECYEEIREQLKWVLRKP